MLKKLLGVIRAPFLLLVPASLAPAFAIAWRHTATLDTTAATLVIVAGLAAHIAVNALNEYEDFRSGLDFTTTRTPFSGGSGTLVAHASFAPIALSIALLALLITFAIGVYFVRQLGSAVVVPGLIGVAIIVAYTRWINRFPLLCLFAPGIGFGFLMVNLAVLGLTGRTYPSSLWVSLPITLLVSNLLLVNQLPDIDADRQAGRRHIAIAWGTAWASRSAALLLLGTYLAILMGWLVGALPALCLLSLCTIPLAAFVVVRVGTFDPDSPAALIPAQGMNVVLTLTTPLLLAAGLIWG